MITSTQTGLATLLLIALLNGVSADHKYDWNPSISLVDRASEGTNAGWCPDILGFGNSIDCSNMQVHTCKRIGDDTQFGYMDDPTFSGIYAVKYDGSCANGSGGGGCLAVKGEIQAGSEMQVEECNDDSPNQRFVYTTSGYFRISSSGGGDKDLCVGVGDDIEKSQYNFYTRSFLLLECDNAPDVNLQWEVRPMPTNVMDDGGVIEAPPAETEAPPVETPPEIDVDASGPPDNLPADLPEVVDLPEEVLEDVPIPEELEEFFDLEFMNMTNMTNATNTTLFNVTYTNATASDESKTSLTVDIPSDMLSDLAAYQTEAERGFN